MTTAAEIQQMRLFRTYQDCDPNTPEDRRFLARVCGATIGVTIAGPSKLDVEMRAQAWLDEQEAKRRRNAAKAEGVAQG